MASPFDSLSNRNTSSSSLFARPTANQPPTGSSMFGTTAQPTQSLSGNPGTNSSFYTTQPIPPPPGGYQTTNPPAAYNSPDYSTSTANFTVPNNALGASIRQDVAQRTLQQSGFHAQNAGEKSVWDQAKTLCAKWDPQSQDTVLQTYLYNAVNPAYAPFYHQNADESARDWEAALAAKPTPAKGEEAQISYVPVLVRGFKALGERVELQIRVVNEMRLRLHEMNHSLDAVMSAHQQRIVIRLDGARKLRITLAQRTLSLAVKVQLLRNRGYALDAAEEALRKSLLSLEAQVMDPGFAGREEEIWARMVQLRERTRWLEAEGNRVASEVQRQPAGRDGKDETGGRVPEEVLQRTQRILRDYDDQLEHLSKELESVRDEFEAWEKR